MESQTLNRQRPPGAPAFVHFMSGCLSLQRRGVSALPAGPDEEVCLAVAVFTFSSVVPASGVFLEKSTYSSGARRSSPIFSLIHLEMTFVSFSLALKSTDPATVCRGHSWERRGALRAPGRRKAPAVPTKGVGRGEKVRSQFLWEERGRDGVGGGRGSPGCFWARIQVTLSSRSPSQHRGDPGDPGPRPCQCAGDPASLCPGVDDRKHTLAARNPPRAAQGWGRAGGTCRLSHLPPSGWSCYFIPLPGPEERTGPGHQQQQQVGGVGGARPRRLSNGQDGALGGKWGAEEKATAGGAGAKALGGAGWGAAQPDGPSDGGHPAAQSSAAHSTLSTVGSHHSGPAFVSATVLVLARPSPTAWGNHPVSLVDSPPLLAPTLALKPSPSPGRVPSGGTGFSCTARRCSREPHPRPQVRTQNNRQGAGLWPLTPRGQRPCAPSWPHPQATAGPKEGHRWGAPSGMSAHLSKGTLQLLVPEGFLPQGRLVSCEGSWCRALPGGEGAGGGGEGRRRRRKR